MFPGTTRLVLSNNKNYSVKLHVGLLAAQNLWDGANITWKICKQCFSERLQRTSKDLHTAMFKSKQKQKKSRERHHAELLNSGAERTAMPRNRTNACFWSQKNLIQPVLLNWRKDRGRSGHTKNAEKGKTGLKRPNLRKILIKLEKVEIYWK